MIGMAPAVVDHWKRQKERYIDVCLVYLALVNIKA